MKDFLQDLVSHTHTLGFLPLIKISSTEKETAIESMAEDRSVILNAKTHNPVDDLEGTFGMPNLNKLDIHLKCPEYKEGASINVVKQERNGETIVTGLHFANNTGDFENDYRFMNSEIINERLKSVKFKGAKWDIEFAPTVSSIQKLKYQAAAHTEEPVFQVSLDNGSLVFSFGDASTHAGSFVFQSGIDAIEFFEANADQLKTEKILINLDINMPGMNGFEFLEEYEKRFARALDCDVIILSSSQDPKDKAKASQFEIVKKFYRDRRVHGLFEDVAGQEPQRIRAQRLRERRIRQAEGFEQERAGRGQALDGGFAGDHRKIVGVGAFSRRESGFIPRRCRAGRAHAGRGRCAVRRRFRR